MIIQGDCLQVMKTYPENHFSGILTDPPYGLKFMGKSWDHSVPGKEFWIEALRICKPGAMMLCFGGSRTYHRLTCAIEDAGWEIRDCLMYLYGSGFPKSHNKFGLEGYGTALKPAYEPILLCMKPLDGTFAQNAEKWGQAGLNIDGCRIPTTENRARKNNVEPGFCGGWGTKDTENHPKGRWPSNLLLDEEAAKMLDEMSGIEASRFFYCSKASSAERNRGCEGLPLKEGGIKNDSGRGFSESDPHKKIMMNNPHPTVKPLRLLEYLLKLISPPKNALILDPFAGSGSTCVAAKKLGIECIGIEINPEYCEIAHKREEAA